MTWSYPTVLFALIVMHCLCDYPWQGPFLSQAKNQTTPIPGVPPIHALAAHAMIHGGGTALVFCLAAGTPNVWGIGLAEASAHLLIDDAKCTGRLGEGEDAYHNDQALHLICKLVWIILVGMFLRVTA